MKRIVGLLAGLVLLCGTRGWGQEIKGREPAAAGFSFYGLRFGMSPEDVRRIVPTTAAGTEAEKPGHGMSFLVFSFDYRNRLQEIRASYSRPPDALQMEALRRALQEKFVQPIGLRWRGIAVKIDEYSNQAAITLVLTSLDQREEAINHFKDSYLQTME